ncbi:MAG: hypothetical protein QOF25_4407, partial [Mycobacterium sp.]|nr:hypothetical protein [Mycobacterium sp.]
MTGRSRTRRVLAGMVAVLAVMTMLLACARTVDGTAARAGSGDNLR